MELRDIIFLLLTGLPAAIFFNFAWKTYALIDNPKRGTIDNRFLAGWYAFWLILGINFLTSFTNRLWWLLVN